MTVQDLFDKYMNNGIFARCATFHYAGRLIDRTDDAAFIVLDKATWVADSGRFGEALKNKSFSQFENYVNPVMLNTNFIVDFTPWDVNALPNKT